VKRETGSDYDSAWDIEGLKSELTTLQSQSVVSRKALHTPHKGRKLISLLLIYPDLYLKAIKLSW